MPEAPSLESLTVVIPTYNREKVLAKALEAYRVQSSPAFIHELIVVDDGSTDGTEPRVREFAARAAFPVRYLRQPNQGPAAARNFGIRETRSALVLFTDSDILPGRDLVSQHIAWHQANPQMNAAVLGFVTWPKEIRATPFMRWYGEHKLFFFDQLRRRKEADFRFFYTCNVSLKTEFIRTGGSFDEEFRSAAFEDTELGFRLSKRGMQLLYNPAAVAYHDQYFSFEEACRKSLSTAPAAQVFLRKEAGQQMERETQQRQSRISYAIASRIAAVVATLLFPLRQLMDSTVPLPGIVYHLLFWDRTRQPRQRT
ncbi:MAG: glycosyltransferase family 2 protein [Candidatus Sulfotelmatobacter sp.]